MYVVSIYNVVNFKMYYEHHIEYDSLNDALDKYTSCVKCDLDYLKREIKSTKYFHQNMMNDEKVICIFDTKVVNRTPLPMPLIYVFNIMRQNKIKKILL